MNPLHEILIMVGIDRYEFVQIVRFDEIPINCILRYGTSNIHGISSMEL